MYNMKDILRDIRRTEERRTKAMQREQANRDAKALILVSRYKDLYELLGDAIYLGHIKGEIEAVRYVLDVRRARYLEEKISWDDRRELFRLAARQRA